MDPAEHEGEAQNGGSSSGGAFELTGTASGRSGPPAMGTTGECGSGGSWELGRPRVLLRPNGVVQRVVPSGSSVVTLPDPLDAEIAVWWLPQYAGGLFVPLRDRSAGDGSYGGGRYLLDTAKAPTSVARTAASSSI